MDGVPLEEGSLRHVGQTKMYERLTCYNVHDAGGLEVDTQERRRSLEAKPLVIRIRCTQQ